MFMLQRLSGAAKNLISKNGIFLCVFAVLIFFLFFWRLGTLTAGLSANEVAAGQASASISAIVNNPLYGPHKVLQFISQKLLGHGSADLRIISAAFGVFFVFCFYQLVRGWFGKLVAFFSTLFFTSTPWFVLLSRNASPDILLMAPLALLACYYWAAKSDSNKSYYSIFILASLSLYIPGMIWLIGGWVIFCRRHLGRLVKSIKVSHRIIAATLAVGLTIPLLYGAVKNPGLLADIALLPDQWPNLLAVLKGIGWSMLSIFWQTPMHADFIIDRAAMLNYAQFALTIFGCYALLKHAGGKLLLLVYLTAFGIIAASININLSVLTIIYPALALAAASGLRYLFMEWRGVFPRNPIPKYWALGLISVLTIVHVGYGIRYSLVAWPNNSQTENIFVIK